MKRPEVEAPCSWLARGRKRRTRNERKEKRKEGGAVNGLLSFQRK